MYEKFYKLECQPFENTADPRFFFASEQHREAMAAIEYSVRMRKGIVMVTGAIGAGKTTVTRSVCDRLRNFTHIVPVLHSPDSPDAMLRQILRGLDTRYNRADDHPRLLQRLRESATAIAELGQPVTLLADEAQTMPDAALEELRLLGNMEYNGRKIIVVVLVGQPELRRRIRTPHFESLRQRIVVAKQLRPLGLEETGQYIAHRLKVASLDQNDVQVEFDSASLYEIFRFSGGTPRLINFVCDNCLLLGYVREARLIKPALVRTVLADMIPSFEEQDDVSGNARPRLSLAGNF